jgi:hypothetical protein
VFIVRVATQGAYVDEEEVCLADGDHANNTKTSDKGTKEREWQDWREEQGWTSLPTSLRSSSFSKPLLNNAVTRADILKDFNPILSQLMPTYTEHLGTLGACDEPVFPIAFGAMVPRPYWQRVSAHIKVMA